MSDTKLKVLRREVDDRFKALFKNVQVSGANTGELSDFALDLEETARAIRRRINAHRHRRNIQLVASEERKAG